VPLTIFLGAEAVGKSTILKQMRVIYSSGFSAEDRMDFKSVLWKNLLSAFETVIYSTDRFGNEDWKAEDREVG
jgi:predicted ATPase